MFYFMHRLDEWLRSSFVQLFILVGLILLVWGTLAPVGTLIWWLNQSQKSLKWQNWQTMSPYAGDGSNSTEASISCYIVYLPGVGDASANQLTRGEEWFLDQLVQQHPDCVSVRDVFPYSAGNEDLVGERFLSPLWRAAINADGWLQEADILIKIRNLWRFAISADDRYGPVYGQGVADAILDRMNVASPISETNQKSLKVILIGTSGGVQVALGAAPHLNNWLHNPELYVISAGGDFDGGAGFDSIDQMYHLEGKRDWVEDVSTVVFPARWWWTFGSPFNRARQQNRFLAMSSGPHTHDGEEGYFGLAIAEPQNTTYVALTLQVVNQLPLWSNTGSGSANGSSPN